jgi:hypothetical protein
MARDEKLAARVRKLLADRSDLTERRTFGGLTFIARWTSPRAGGRTTVPSAPSAAHSSRAAVRSALHDEGGTMVFQVGDRVVAESESTERAPRAGTVREVLRDAPARYRIEWDDGHE